MNMDDDGMKMFGMILVAAVILILLSTCFFQNGEQEVGPRCREGEIYLEHLNCCSEDGLYCSGSIIGCIEVPCDDYRLCCVPDVCETLLDGSQRCMPCSTNSRCNPDEEPSCCTNMFCDENGYCKHCKDYPCNSIEDCCDNYECNDFLCESCERICGLNEDCCDGWQCLTNECINCDIACYSDLDCCEGDNCNPSTLRCEGCKIGAYCSPDRPCCDGFECNIITSECEDCERPCDSTSDCCEGGFCYEGKCRSSDDCSDLPCFNPGEVCLVDPLCVENCVECTDDSICVKRVDSPLFTCKSSGNCPPGSYDCSDVYLNCNCCNAFTGECLDEKTLVKCGDIDNCDICSCKEYEVYVCPPGNVFCPGKGCYKPVSYNLNPVCHTCSISGDACCTYLVPLSGLPVGVDEVNYNVCLSGYRHTTGCITRLDYFYDIDIEQFVYEFRLPSGNVLRRSSKVGPNQIVISNVKIASFDCANLNVEFTSPQLFRVG